MNRKLLHKWTRAGDGDPRSTSYYNNEDGIDEPTAQQLSRSPFAWMSPQAALPQAEDSTNDICVGDTSMVASTGLQSRGLQSNAHAFREQTGPDVHAMQQIYTDLDEANEILERFCNKHMLPPPLEAEAERRIRKIRLKMNYMPSNSQHVIFDTYSSGGAGMAAYLQAQE